MRRQPPHPISSRAQLVTIARDLKPLADLAAVSDYLSAIIADAPAT